MRNFEIARYGQFGEPIYSKKSPDHKIMACALAILAFARLVEHIDSYPYRPGLGKITNDLSKKIRFNTLKGEKYSRTKMENIINHDVVIEKSGSKSIAELSGLSIPFGGIIGSDGKFPSESKSVPRKSFGSTYNNNHKGRRRF